MKGLSLPLLLALALTVGVMVPVQARTLDMCWKIAKFAKQLAPHRMDSVTVMTDVICMPARTAGAKHEVTYMVTIEVPLSRMKGVSIQELRPGLLNTWCTEPSMKKTLSAYDVKYKYWSSDGKFIGDLSLAIKDCH